MRKSYTFGIPFGLQRESGLFLDITEVSRGIVTNGAIVIHTQRLKSDPGGNLLS
ncbi:chemotaxis protein [Salmonella enterica subsp. enterica serovar Kentucky]|nr:chemotaxis protein [Salmonella enterica subsp. enterica serovar Kentucky]